MSELWLDGGFWGAWIRQNFRPEIAWMKHAALDIILPAFPDPSEQGEEEARKTWEAYMAQPYDENVDPADLAEKARDKGIEVYSGIIKTRQAAVNLHVVMLWHLLEQQMLIFHSHQVLSVHEESRVYHDKQERSSLHRVSELRERLREGGCPLEDLTCWAKVCELKLAANAIKHGEGRSLDELRSLRPDLLSAEDSADHNQDASRRWVERPAGGKDIYVQDDDLRIYFDMALQFWDEFSRAVEEHSAHHRSGSF